MEDSAEKVLSPRHMLVGGYIILSDIQLSGLPEAINYEGNRLVRKSEFHITIASTTKIAEILGAKNPDKVKAEIIDEFQNYISKNKLDQFKLRNEFRFVTRDARKTIAVMCGFPGGNQFFETLEKRFGKPLPRQPFHITIYSLEPEVGISISSPEELEKTKQINLPELQSIQQV